MSHRLLMIDDDTRILKSLERFFELQGGWRFTGALGVAEGFSLLEKELPDVLILDCDIDNDPEAGLKFLRTLRRNARYEDLPVVVLTGTRRQRGQVAEGLEMGAAQYLAKPIRPQDLLQRLEALIRFVRRTGG
jgi:DNA-binding response OmpR family regulator